MPTPLYGRRRYAMLPRPSVVQTYYPALVACVHGTCNRSARGRVPWAGNRGRAQYSIGYAVRAARAR